LVIITGVIRDGWKSVEGITQYVNGATVTYGSTTTSSVDGFFQISSDVAESSILTIYKERFVTIPVSLISFGTKYDPDATISGTVLDATSVSGSTDVTSLTVTDMNLVPDAFISSTIRVTGGVDSGQICYIISNTENTFYVKF
jgi:hypothetical protein